MQGFTQIIPDGPIPYHLLLEDQAAKEAEEASREAMEAAIEREGWLLMIIDNH